MANVKFPRPIVSGTKGRDVLAVKRALSRAGYIKWGDFTPVCGNFMIESIHEFQKDHKIPKAGYGPKTHEALAAAHVKGKPKQWAFDAYGIEIMNEMYLQFHISPEERIRHSIISMARWLYAHRYNISYSQRRPFPLVPLGGRVPTGLDCSGMVSLAYYGGGAIDPNAIYGRRLTWQHDGGEGYTGTLQQGSTRVYDLRDLKMADAVFYGFTSRATPAFPVGAPTHVALWSGEGDDSVYSMGSYPMRRAHYRYRHDVHSYRTFPVTNLRGFEAELLALSS